MKRDNREGFIEQPDGSLRIADRTIRKLRDLGYHCYDLTDEEKRRIFGRNWRERA